MTTHIRCLFVVLVLASAAADWPQWQGPARDAVSKEKGLLKEWPEGGPKLAWKTEKLGGGDSAPSVAAGVLYGMSIRDGKEVVWALSEKDGKEMWVAPLADAYRQRMPQSKEGPGCTPTVDGDRLYVLGMAGDLACMQAKDGKILWQASMTKDFGGRVPQWSYRESPLVDGDKVVATPGGRDATLVAFDKKSGKVEWKSKVAGNPGAGYSSIIAFDFGGKRHYAQLTARTVVGVDAADGKMLWKYDAPASRFGINCSTPLYHEDHVFAASAYGAGGGLAKLEKDGDGFKAEEVYFSKKMMNHHGGMIQHEGALYGANGGNEGGNLVCLDWRTGKVNWDERTKGGKGVKKGSLAMADGMLYYRTEDGTVVLVEPDAKKYSEKGRLKQPDRTDSPAWAHPVVANGKLYIRDHDTLYCYDVKAK